MLQLLNLFGFEGDEIDSVDDEAKQKMRAVFMHANDTAYAVALRIGNDPDVYLEAMEHRMSSASDSVSICPDTRTNSRTPPSSL